MATGWETQGPQQPRQGCLDVECRRTVAEKISDNKCPWLSCTQLHVCALTTKPLNFSKHTSFRIYCRETSDELLLTSTASSSSISRQHVTQHHKNYQSNNWDIQKPCQTLEHLCTQRLWDGHACKCDCHKNLILHSNYSPLPSALRSHIRIRMVT